MVMSDIQYPVGNTTVTFVAVDSAANDASCSISVAVADSQAPSINDATCTDVTLNTDIGASHAVSSVLGDPLFPTIVATDNAVLHPTITVTIEGNEVSDAVPFPVGETTVTYAASDGFSNDSCSIIVTVTDNQPPTIDPASCVDINAATDRNQSYGTALESIQDLSAVVAVRANASSSSGTEYGVAVSDNAQDLDSLSVSAYVLDGAGELVPVTNTTQFTIGETVVTLIASDGINHEMSDSNVCNITVTVTDDEPPNLFGCLPITAITDDGANYATLTSDQLIALAEVTAVDNSNETASISVQTPAGDPITQGTFLYSGVDRQFATTVVIVVVDSAGNAANCSVNVTVEDTEPPAFTPPPSLAVEADVSSDWIALCNSDAGCAGTYSTLQAVAALPMPVSISDNSGDSLTLTAEVIGNGSNTTGPLLLPAAVSLTLFDTDDSRSAGSSRTYNVNYEVIDSHGNAATASVSILVLEKDGCTSDGAQVCRNGAVCTDLLADEYGYHEAGTSRMIHLPNETYDGRIRRLYDFHPPDPSMWLAYAAAHPGILRNNSSPGFQCSCTPGWEGERCDDDVNECTTFNCTSPENGPCFGPCENSATCTESTSDSSIEVNNYVCECPAAYSGPNCEYFDECAANPCSGMSIPSFPANISAVLQDGSVHLCPVQMSCVDSDVTTTDSYVCSCPSCADAVYPPQSAARLAQYFSTFAETVGRRLATLHQRLLLPPPICGGSGAYGPDCSGCTDASSPRWDPAATVDDGTCEATIAGCMDPTASNYDPSANSYSWADHSNATTQCHAAGVIEPVDECEADPCGSFAHRLCASTPPLCTDARPEAFMCGAAQSGMFSCVDPNPYWPGDYVCTCSYDMTTGGFENVTADCGAETLYSGDAVSGRYMHV
eukprot:SAG31_NODE_1327_length_8759_cov_4.689723_2_plen_894_part_00